MTHFEFLSVALSFVLGLAVTVLLTSLITAFRSRRNTRMTWLPLAWAVMVLVQQFDVILMVVAARRRVVQYIATVGFAIWLDIYLWAFVPARY